MAFRLLEVAQHCSQGNDALQLATHDGSVVAIELFAKVPPAIRPKEIHAIGRHVLRIENLINRLEGKR